MNFRPTKGKVIWSVIITILFSVIIFLSNKIMVPSFESAGKIRQIISLIDVGHPFSLGNIFLFLIVFVVLYIIISIFQRRRLPPLPNTRM
jgi:hypothetical protein